MQESGAYCICIHAELFYKYICYCYRVRNIRLSGRAENTVVRLFRQLISRLYFIKVVALSYLLYLVNKSAAFYDIHRTVYSVQLKMTEFRKNMTAHHKKTVIHTVRHCNLSG